MLRKYLRMSLISRLLSRKSYIPISAIAITTLSFGLAANHLNARPAPEQTTHQVVPAKPTAPTLIVDNRSISALSAHLKKIGAKMYGAYWCPHCTHQKDMFGTAAFKNIDYVECDPRGEKARPELCKAAKIQGYPTWEIRGKFFTGVQSLEELAKYSGYKGTSDF